MAMNPIMSLRNAVSIAARRSSALHMVSVRYASTEHLKRTVLYDRHKEAGGVMVDYAGYAMPVNYKGGHAMIAGAESIMNSTEWTRTSTSLFDVSHMCSIRWTGKDAQAFLEHVTVADLDAMPVNSGKLSLITTEEGGILDDTMITRCEDHFYQVVNAGCADKDIAHFDEQLGKFGGDVQMDVQWDQRGLFALQGPGAHLVLQSLVDVDLSKITFGISFTTNIDNVPCFISRCGYTGEDGFEIFVDGDSAVPVFDKIMENDKVRLAGLGARDALRLEAGLCLYGNELAEYTPAEAGLTWTIRKTDTKQKFLGYEPIMAQVNDRTLIKKLRCGLFPEGAPARTGAVLLNMEGEEVGLVTSGAYSPTLKKNISMGYALKPFNKRETSLQVSARGKTRGAVVTKMPFVPTNYYTAST